MHQLSKNQYAILSPLVKDIHHNKALIHVGLEGNSQGTSRLEFTLYKGQQ